MFLACSCCDVVRPKRAGANAFLPVLGAFKCVFSFLASATPKINKGLTSVLRASMCSSPEVAEVVMDDDDSREPSKCRRRPERAS